MIFKLQFYHMLINNINILKIFVFVKKSPIIEMNAYLLNFEDNLGD